MTHSNRVLACFRGRDFWFDDDQVAKALGIRARQQGNRICRSLASERESSERSQELGNGEDA